MAKRSKQTPRLRTREDEEPTQQASLAEVRQENSAKAATSEGTQVNCYDEVYSYAGKWYGPGTVTIKDPEAADAVQKAIDRVEGQKQAAEEARKKGVAHTPAQSTTHHWVRGDNVAAPIIPATGQFGDDDEEDEDDEDELEFRREGTAQADGTADEESTDDEESDDEG